MVLDQRSAEVFGILPSLVFLKAHNRRSSMSTRPALGCSRWPWNNTPPGQNIRWRSCFFCLIPFSVTVLLRTSFVLLWRPSSISSTFRCPLFCTFSPEMQTSSRDDINVCNRKGHKYFWRRLRRVTSKTRLRCNFRISKELLTSVTFACNAP